MCGRYFIDDSLEGFEPLIEALNRGKPGGTPAVQIKTGEIRPTDVAPAIANSRARRQRPFLMRWGFGGRDSHVVINARSETALVRPMFRDAMLERRCLVPASYYFEWQAQGKRRIKHAMKADGPVMYMAGLYRLEEGRPVFTILTREPAPQIAFIHNRMPVILSRDAAGAWLHLQTPAAEVLAQAAQDVVYGAVT